MTASATPSNTLDSLIHETARLTIVSVLAECDRASFNFLLTTTGLTRGNLSTHLRRLSDAGYVDEKKEIVDRRPWSEYRLTRSGRNAFARYQRAWKEIIQGSSRRSAR